MDAMRNGVMPPMNRPIRTSGLPRCSEKSPPRLYATVSTKAAMMARAASAAAPMANPLPIAAVVLPSSSRESVMARVSSPSPAISAMPPALSATGPYASTAMVMPTVASRPTAAIPTP